MADSPEIAALLKRYKDAYGVARVIVAFGGFIKVGGIVLGVLIGFGGFSAGGRLALAYILLAVVVGVLFYLAGVVASAQGEILQASLDTAVNSSPFLQNEHRAQIMSLAIASTSVDAPSGAEY